MVSASEPGHYDAILMDIQMPVMDGYEATRAIRGLDDPALAGIPIVALTANAFQEDVEAAKKAGMVAHIAKPVDVQKMLATLRSVLEHR
jgi:CheY-like chemotaxis protein